MGRACSAPVLSEKIVEFKEAGYLSYGKAAKAVGWGMKSLRRYLERIGKAEPPVKRRGRKPCVIELKDIEALKRDLGDLNHGAKRSPGTGDLQRKYRSSIPRALFRKLASQARKERRTALADSWSHVFWNCPRQVWSMDITELPFNGRTFYVLQTMDMTTKYRFEPLIGTEMFNGEEVAGHAAWLYAKYGAPLFQKRDNGGNLNAQIMREVLSAHCVVPLNSPPYYPRYNGTMEHAQNELQDEVERIVAAEGISTDEGFVGALHRATYGLNHKRRPILHGETSCFNWSRHIPPQYSKQQREEEQRWIEDLALDIAQDSTCNDKDLWFTKAWRVAVEAWLVKSSFISVTKPDEVLPISA